MTARRAQGGRRSSSSRRSSRSRSSRRARRSAGCRPPARDARRRRAAARLDRSARSAASVGGLLLDTATLETLGLTSLILTLGGYWIGRYGETTGRDRTHAPFVSVAVVTVLYAVGVLVLALPARRSRAPAGACSSTRSSRRSRFNLILTAPGLLARRRAAPAGRLARAREGGASSLASAGGTRGTRFLPPDPRVEEPYRLTPQAALRVAILGGSRSSSSALLFLRLWALEVLSGQQYLRRRAEQPAPDGAARGAARRDPRPQRPLLVDNRAGTAVQLWPADLPKQVVAALARAPPPRRRSLGVPARRCAPDRQREGDPLTPVTSRRRRTATRSTTSPSTATSSRASASPTTYVRMYPHGSLAAQLLGYVGEIYAAAAEARAGGLQPGDEIGQSGIESAFDGYLRGQRGIATLRVDALGRPRSAAEPRVAAPGQRAPAHDRPRPAARRRAGAPLRDPARARLELHGCWDANGGAIVALDPRDGSVLAIASSPTFKPSVYAGRVDDEASSRAQGLDAGDRAATNYPALNRAIAGRLSAGLDVQAGDRARGDAGAPDLPSSTLPVHRHVHVAGRTRAPGLQQLGPVRQPARWTCRRRSRRPATRTSTSSATTSTGCRRAAATRSRTGPAGFGFGQPTGHRHRPEAAGLLPTPEWRQTHFTRPTRLWQIDSSGSRATRSSSRSARRTCS